MRRGITVQALLFARQGAEVLPPPVVVFASRAMHLYSGDSVKWRRLLVHTAGATRKRVYDAAKFLPFLRALALEVRMAEAHVALVVRAVMMMLLECKATSALPVLCCGARLR